MSSQEPNPSSSAEPPRPDEDEEIGEMTRELVEAVATVYFGACRKIASTVNRLKNRRERGR